MTSERTHVRIAPKGMGLNDFVAYDEGFMSQEGLDVEFDWKIFRGTQSSWKGVDYFQRPQDKPFAEGRSVIQGACAWGSVCNASAGMGKFVPDCYGISPWGIFVRPDSKIKKPEDLGVAVAARLKVLKTVEPATRKSGVKVANVAELVSKLKTEAGVI